MPKPIRRESEVTVRPGSRTTLSPSWAPYGVVPLGASIERVRSRQNLLEIRLGAPECDAGQPRGWRGCAEMLGDPDAFTRWRATLADWLTAEFGDAPDRTTAGYVQAWYLQVPAYLAALLFHHERRVPSLRPEHLSFRIAEQGRPHPDGIALDATEFACLPGDPAADTPGVTVVSSEESLAGLLRARYASHAAEFVRAYGPTVRFGRHALWAAATDGLDVCLWRAGRLGGDEGAGVADAALVLPDALPPFTSASTMRTTCGEGGKLAWTRRKQSCCYHYLVDGGNGECSTCPRRTTRP